MDLAPPADNQSFFSLPEAIEQLNRYGAAHGYALRKTNSKTTRDGGPYRVYIGCDRGGKVPQARAEVLRKSASKKTGCPFSGLLRWKDPLWHLQIRVPGHNHGPSDPIAHPAHRRLGPRAMRLVDQLSQANATPKTIVTALQIALETPISPGEMPEASSAPPLPKDISNLLYKLRTAHRESQIARTIDTP